MTKTPKIALILLTATATLTLAYHLLTYGGAPIQHTPLTPTPHPQPTPQTHTYTPSPPPQPRSFNPTTPTKPAPPQNQDLTPTLQTDPQTLTDKMFTSYINLAEKDFQDIFDPKITSATDHPPTITLTFKHPYNDTEFTLKMTPSTTQITIHLLDGTGTPYGPTSTITYYANRLNILQVEYSGADGITTIANATDTDIQDFNNLIKLTNRITTEQKTQTSQNDNAPITIDIYKDLHYD